jgi:DUF1009 family protein
MATTSPDKRTYAFGAGDRVAIVAGGGRLPVDVAEGLAKQERPPLVLLVRGEANPSAFAAFETEAVSLGQFAELPSLLKKRGVNHLVLAGSISRRPKWHEIRPSLALFRRLSEALVALARGDDGLLSIYIRGVEREGIRVVGAHEIVPDLLAAEGKITRVEPRQSDQRDIDAAYRAAHALGALDIGQGAIAIGGRVVAVEGVEGTDGLLQRTKELRGHGRLAGKTRGVLVKCAKPGQELRADLPSIGPATVEAAHAAGLAGIGVEAGNALILDSAKVVECANALGVFVIGLPPGGPK